MTKVDAIIEAQNHMQGRYLELLTAALLSEEATDDRVTPAELTKLLEILSSARNNVPPEQQIAAWLKYALQLQN